MKKIKLLAILFVAALTIVSCTEDSNVKTTLIDFEDVTLSEEGFTSATFTTKGITFEHKENYWEGGIAVSSHINTENGEYTNQYSVIAGSGAFDSKKFAVVYAPAEIIASQNENGHFKAKSIYLTNSTYAYLTMKNGNMFSDKFGENDWFKVIITGYLNNTKTANVEYYLADFRNGKSFISNTWEKLDISKLGEVDKLTFSFEGSDVGEWGLNTPSYVCFDNLEFSQD